MAVDDAAVGPHLDLQDGGIFGAADRGEGSAAAATTTVFARDRVVFVNGREVGMVATTWPRSPGLLAASPVGPWRL